MRNRIIADRVNKLPPNNATALQGKITAVNGRTATVEVAGQAYSGVPALDHVLLGEQVGCWLMDIGGGRWLIIGTNVQSYSGGRRNLIHNGDARIWQRGAAVTTGAWAIYGVDRWTIGYANSFTAENTRVDGASTDPVRYWVRAKVNTADASLGAGEYFAMTQPVEGRDIAHLRWGTSLAQPITISFWVKASIAGTYSVAIRNDGATRSYVAPFVVNAANVPEFKALTIPGCTDGTWAVDETMGLSTWFGLGQGSTFSTSSSNTWLSSNMLGITGAVNMMPTVNSTFDLGNVQLEAGMVATPFEVLPYGQSLDICHRYFQRWIDPPLRGVVGGGGTSGVRMAMPLPVRMRIAPTTTLSGTGQLVWDGAAGATINSIATSYNRGTSIEYDVNLSAGLTIGRALVAYNNTGSIWDLSAEF